MTIRRAVPNIRSDRPADTRDFFVTVLGFDVVMDMDWVVTVASPANPSMIRDFNQFAGSPPSEFARRRLPDGGGVIGD